MENFGYCLKDICLLSLEGFVASAIASFINCKTAVGRPPLSLSAAPYVYFESDLVSWHFWAVLHRLVIFRESPSALFSLAGDGDGHFVAACIRSSGVFISAHARCAQSV